MEAEWSTGRRPPSGSLLVMLMLVMLTMMMTARGAVPVVCPLPRLLDLVSHPGDHACLTPRDGTLQSRVVEMNGISFERALNLLHNRRDVHMVVLFYADWCLFSRSLRSTLDTLSVLFPSIYHIAVEESALRPSALTKYGVHSFPSLFLHTKNLRIRYYGPRTIKALSTFYKDMIGFDPMDMEEDMIAIAMDSGDSHGKKGTDSWKLQNDLYLLLATLFLLLRACLYLIPKLACVVKRQWNRERFLWRVSMDLRSPTERGRQQRSIDRGKAKVEESAFDECGGATNTLIGLSSLAPVALTEGSSSRTGLYTVDGKTDDY